MALSTLDPWQGASALVAAHALGRAAAIGLLGVLPPVGGDGLGASFAVASTRGRIFGGLMAGAILGFAALGTLSAPAMAAAAAGAGIIAMMARRKLGGLTGDVLGAAEQTAEVLVLLVATAAATNGWAPVVWWR
jgi:adenosylcobinamide-GDP ribazoletransferase